MIDGASLAAEMHHGFAEGIGCNLRGLRKCEHLILLMRVNKDTLVDVKLCCVMLRALWSLGMPRTGVRELGLCRVPLRGQGKCEHLMLLMRVKSSRLPFLSKWYQVPRYSDRSRPRL
jgi:hypothetical protein